MADPKLVLNKFAGVGNGGFHYLEGFQPFDLDGHVILRQNFKVDFTLNSSSHADWANLPILTAMAHVYENGADYAYGIGNKYITRHKMSTPASESYGAILHAIAQGTSTYFCKYPDILKTETGNLLYTQRQHLGKAIYGIHDGGDDATNNVVDSLARDLSALGVTAGDLIYNLRDGSFATVTGVSGVGNKQIDFSGNWSGSADIDDGDEWVCMVDDAHDFDDGSEYPHFPGQLSMNNWSRTIINFDGDYFMGNGVYISKLDNDETTWDNVYSKLPENAEVQDMAVRSDRVLIGANVGGQAMILLWDGVTQNKYLSKEYLKGFVSSVKQYRSGWLFLVGNTIYWTDGYASKKLSAVPDSNEFWNAEYCPKSMNISGDLAVISAGIGDANRTKDGVWIYNIIRNEWMFNPYEASTNGKSLNNTTNGSVFRLKNGTTDKILVSYADDASKKSLSEVKAQYANSNTSMAIIRYNSVGALTINNVEVTLAQRTSEILSQSVAGTLICAIANNDYALWTYGTVNGNSTSLNKIVVDGTSTTSNKGKVGDMIRILENNARGEIAFIASIAGAGTSSETYTLDRNLSALPQDTALFQIMPFHKMQEYTIAGRQLDSPYVFASGQEVHGDFFVLVYLLSTTGVFEIRNLAIY